MESLAKAYKHSTSWDTRRQVLSVMAGVASFNAISAFIPGLTHYRYNISNLHRLQHGSGALVPKDKAPRIRINLQQLDHFLSFITSPHLVQDLPFGEKTLRALIRKDNRRTQCYSYYDPGADSNAVPPVLFRI